MREKRKGKAVEEESFNNFTTDFNYSASSEFPCKEHPFSSSVGICAFCLKDRLINLICSHCGGHRQLCSCSCSDPSEVILLSNPCANTDVGSVGRISFLIENDTNETETESDHRHIGPTVEFQRSSSSCIEAKKVGGFRRIGRFFFFRKKVAKDELISAFDYKPVSRSRSLCSFRGGSFRDPEDSSDFTFSSAKISDVNGGSMIESARISCFSSETEPRKSGFRGYSDVSSFMPSLKQSEFIVNDDDSAFIDLKLDTLEPKAENSLFRNGDSNLRNLCFIENGGPICRNRDGGMRRGETKKKKKNVWKGIIRHHRNWSRTHQRGRHDKEDDHV